MTMKYIYIRNKRMRLGLIHAERIQKDIPVLIFLHEALGSIDLWKSFPQELSDELNLPALVYDRFGHGDSDPMELPREKGYLEKEAFEILPELLNHLDINRVILVGHSDGASIALLYASKYKEQALAVISMATHVFVEEAGLRGIMEARIAYESRNLKQKLLQYHGDKTDDLFYAWNNTWSSENYRDWNMESCLKEIKSPVLVIQGEDDEYASMEQVTRVSRQVAGHSEEFIVPKCAHIPFLQAKKVVLERVVGFLKQTGVTQD